MIGPGCLGFVDCPSSAGSRRGGVVVAAAVAVAAVVPVSSCQGTRVVLLGEREGAAANGPDGAGNVSPVGLALSNGGVP